MPRRFSLILKLLGIPIVDKFDSHFLVLRLIDGLVAALVADSFLVERPRIGLLGPPPLRFPLFFHAAPAAAIRDHNDRLLIIFLKIEFGIMGP